MTNADTARRRGIRRLAVLLLALVAALSVTAHHELMAMGGMGGTSATRAMGDGSMAVSHVASVPGHHAPVADHVASGIVQGGVVQGGCAEGGSMCTAAGVAGQPLPAALPQRAIPDAASPAGPRVGSLPPGAGPPAPADTTSVLRI